MNNEQRKDYYSVVDIVKFLQLFLRYVNGKKWLLLIALVAGVGLGVIAFFMQKPKYEAVCTFILEEKSTGGSGLAGLASQFGFDMGSIGGGGSLFAGDNILDILKSKKIISKVLLSKVDDHSGEAGATLADNFLEFSGWQKKWSAHPELKNISFSQYKEGQGLSPKQDSVLNLIHEFLLKNSLSASRLNKKGSIIKVNVTASNSTFARLMTERIVDEAAKLYLNIKTGTAQANIMQMQRRSDSLLYLLNRKSYTVAASQPLDINPGIKSAVVPLEIASRDKTVLTTLYAEVTKNLEASKLLLSQQTPVIQLLDRPEQLLKDTKTSLLYLILAFSFSAVFICMTGLLLSFYISKFKLIG